MNELNPVTRIKFVKYLTQGIGRLIVAPPEIIEQLCTKIEQEIKEFESVPEVENANRVAKHHVALLRIFLKYRQPMIDEIKRETGLDLSEPWPT